MKKIKDKKLKKLAKALKVLSGMSDVDRTNLLADISPARVKKYASLASLVKGNFDPFESVKQKGEKVPVEIFRAAITKATGTKVENLTFVNAKGKEKKKMPLSVLISQFWEIEGLNITEAKRTKVLEYVLTAMAMESLSNIGTPASQLKLKFIRKA